MLVWNSKLRHGDRDGYGSAAILPVGWQPCNRLKQEKQFVGWRGKQHRESQYAHSPIRKLGKREFSQMAQQ
jgi:hypothetical protein